MHFKEDTAKPENRTNLALLSILQIKEIKTYLFDKLDLNNDCLIYPCPNLEKEEFSTSLRPDFVIKYFSGKIYGYIEVELGRENNGQINRYRSETSDPVYSIVGKKSYLPADLSLEEIYSHSVTIKTKYSNMQQNVSLELFCTLVKYYVIDGNFKPSNSRSNLSSEMLSSNLLKQIISGFGSENIVAAGVQVVPGKIKIDTIKKNGFSLKVFSKKSTTSSISLMNRSGGGKTIGFPSYKMLLKYLPYKEKACAKYANLISDLGDSDILKIKESERARLPLAIVEENFTKFSGIIKQLW